MISLPLHDVRVLQPTVELLSLHQDLPFDSVVWHGGTYERVQNFWPYRKGRGAPFTVLRLLTLLKMSYEAAKKRAEPYTKIVEELPEMRRDTVELVKKAVGEKRQA
jgi:hypothetical protein